MKIMAEGSRLSVQEGETVVYFPAWAGMVTLQVREGEIAFQYAADAEVVVRSSGLVEIREQGTVAARLEPGCPAEVWIK